MVMLAFRVLPDKTLATAPAAAAEAAVVAGVLPHSNANLLSSSVTLFRDYSSGSYFPSKVQRLIIEFKIKPQLTSCGTEQHAGVRIDKATGCREEFWHHRQSRSPTDSKALGREGGYDSYGGGGGSYGGGFGGGGRGR